MLPNVQGCQTRENLQFTSDTKMANSALATKTVDQFECTQARNALVDINQVGSCDCCIVHYYIQEDGKILAAEAAARACSPFEDSARAGVAPREQDVPDPSDGLDHDPLDRGQRSLGYVSYPRLPPARVPPSPPPPPPLPCPNFWQSPRSAEHAC